MFCLVIFPFYPLFCFWKSSSITDESWTVLLQGKLHIQVRKGIIVAELFRHHFISPLLEALVVFFIRGVVVSLCE